LLLEYTCLAEVFLTLAELDPANYQSDARSACKRLGRFARVFPLASPAHEVWTGLEHWLSGRERKALKKWLRCVEHADQMEMPYFVGLAHYQIARRLGEGQHALMAETTLFPLGERHYTMRARTLIPAKTSREALA
jgi:hypothetical protein